MDGGAWQARVHGVTKRQTRLSNFTFFVFLRSYNCPVMFHKISIPCYIMFASLEHV